MISVPKIIACFSCLCILFCAPLISACTLYLFLPSPEHLLFSPAIPLIFSIILRPKICQKFCHMHLCHFRFANSSLELQNWSNSKHGWGKENMRFSSPHCIGKKQNDLLPHSDGKIQAGYKKQQQTEKCLNVPLLRRHQSLFIASSFCFLPHPQSCSLICACLFINN